MLKVVEIQRVGHLVTARYFSRKRVVVQNHGLHAARAQICPLRGEGSTQIVIVQIQESETGKRVVTFHPVIRDGARQEIATKIQVKKFAQIPIEWKGTGELIVVETYPSCEKPNKGVC